jgi:hypothetical protein
MQRKFPFSQTFLLSYSDVEMMVISVAHSVLFLEILSQEDFYRLFHTVIKCYRYRFVH